MDVYNYVASQSPSVAQDIINSFGYNVVDKNDMGGNLKRLVAEQGEPALKMILDNHPDKDVILEMFESKTKSEHVNCNCESCRNKQLIQEFKNASGNEPSDAKRVENNFSMVFLAGIMVISIAILSSKK